MFRMQDQAYCQLKVKINSLNRKSFDEQINEKIKKDGDCWVWQSTISKNKCPIIYVNKKSPAREGEGKQTKEAKALRPLLKSTLFFFVLDGIGMGGVLFDVINILDDSLKGCFHFAQPFLIFHDCEGTVSLVRANLGNVCR